MFIRDKEYIDFIRDRNYFVTAMTFIVRTSGQLGPALIQLRKARGWSQAEFGRQVGLSQARISAIETHPERVTLNQLLTLLMALDAEIQIEPRRKDGSSDSKIIGEAW